MKFKVFLHVRAAKSLARMPDPQKDRMKMALRELEESPWTKSEQLDPSDFFRLRSVEYSAISEIDYKPEG